MKKLLVLSFVLTCQAIFAQQPYYDDVNIMETGQNLYFELQRKVEFYNTSFTYGEVRGTFLDTDEDTSNNNNVLLVYGYNNNDDNCITDRSRNKNNFGGDNCEYNREHVFARSNANPGMGSVDNGSTGIAADPNNLRPSDVQFNGQRGNKRFGAGTGNAGNVGSGDWFPGDEWKGDVARIMMYMYVRYGNRCLPSLNVNGTKQGTTEMLQVLLQWNVEDPVNAFEDQHNPILETEYGNRNPFIDNPYLATAIWGGPAAEDRWGVLSTIDFSAEAISIFPNPSNDFVWLQTTTASTPKSYILYDLSGRKVAEDNFNSNEKSIDVSALQSGIYLLHISSEGKSVVKKVVVK